MKNNFEDIDLEETESSFKQQKGTVMKMEILQKNAEALLVFNYFADQLTKMRTLATFEAPALGTIVLEGENVRAAFEPQKELTFAVIQTGEAIYHWLTGRSKLNDPSFYMDGYPNLADQGQYFLGKALDNMINIGILPELATLPVEKPPKPVVKREQRQPPKLKKTVKKPQKFLSRSRSHVREKEPVEKLFIAARFLKRDRGSRIYIPKLDDWRSFWEETWKNHGIKLDPSPSNLIIPDYPQDMHPAVLLVLPKGAWLREIYWIWDNLVRFPDYIGFDLNKAIPVNERTTRNGSYAVWVQDCQEPAPTLRNMSALTLASRGIRTETLAERWVHEILYRTCGATGYLDENYMTLCAGSRWKGGKVPVVRCIKLIGSLCTIYTVPDQEHHAKGFRARLVSL